MNAKRHECESLLVLIYFYGGVAVIMSASKMQIRIAQRCVFGGR